MFGREQPMFGTDWEASKREYGMEKREDVPITTSDGTTLFADVLVPDAEGEAFPALLGAHGYNRKNQMDAPIPKDRPAERPSDPRLKKSSIESGDPNFYVRRGYAMVNLNLRGTGDSEGSYRFGGSREIDDTVEAIEWIAEQEWSDGQVGMVGMSYYSVNSQHVAARNPDPLEAVFAPYGWTDWYRDMAYHGGILAHWVTRWWKHNPRPRCEARERLDEAAFRDRIEEAFEDEEIVEFDNVVEALDHPEEHGNLVDTVLHPLDDAYWQERAVDYDGAETPIYVGADWRSYGFHLPGALRTFRNWEGPVKLVMGPGPSLDKPMHQYQVESLRWFDYWMKDVDTGIMDEPPVRYFVPPTGEYETAEEWPLPETIWTPFYLHSGGLKSDQDAEVGFLAEHEIYPGETGDTYADSPFDHGGLRYESAPILEHTTICGPILLNLFASTTATEEFFFATLYDVHPDGLRDEIARGWLRGTQRKVDEDRSERWYAHHPHDEREPLEPNEVYEFNVNIGPAARELTRGHRIGLRIKGADADDENDDIERISLQRTAIGHLETREASRVTVRHDHDYPSHLLLPVTSGNTVGAYISSRPFEGDPAYR